ncbi:hypothetical protein AMJ49_04765 [Parcubacteria bacterium DG_74_2]|nr:MAG: hypothetical protein AMJ49_04765 [Parcubacteria bacterium DG_74_2]
MIAKQDLEKIKNKTEEFFNKAGIKVEINVSTPSEEVVDIDLDIDEPQILIGEKGQTLVEIQRLLKMVLRRKIEKSFFINLDINDYKKKKAEHLKELVQSIADDVALTKKQRTLAPMLAYERRIIHLELGERSDVVTESVGEGIERRIVIKPNRS